MYLSLIVPVYFYNDFVVRMLKSIKNQTFRRFEIVVVGNSLSYEEFRIIQSQIELLMKGVEIRFLHTDLVGANNARKLGYRSSKGDYVFFLDSDDQLTSAFVLQDAVNIITKYNIDILSMNLQHASVGNDVMIPRSVVYNYSDGDNVLFYKNRSDRESIISNFGSNICSRFIRNGLLDDIEFLDVPFNQDWNICSKLFAKANSFYFMSKPGYFWVYRENSISKTSSMTLKSHSDAFNSILDVLAYYERNHIKNKYKDFLVDRVIKYCFNYILRGQVINNNEFILRARQLVIKEVPLRMLISMDIRLVTMYVVIRFGLFRVYNMLKTPFSKKK